METIHYLPVLAAAIAAFVLGALWHGPLFGKVWMRLSNIPESEMKNPPKGIWKLMVAAFVQQVVTAWVFAYFASELKITDLMGALEIAFFAWLGFIVTTLLNGVLWEKRSVNLYLFNIAYHLAALVVMALVIGMWR